MNDRMKQLLMFPKIQWLTFHDSNHDSGQQRLTWYLLKSAGPYIHFLQLKTDWDASLGVETCMLTVKVKDLFHTRLK